MAWDLAVSSAGDLLFSPAVDVQGISGIDLIEQRMSLRLKVRRGSWTYDTDGSFGSQLYKLFSASPKAAVAQAESYVREALREMPEIDVDGVAVSVEGTALSLAIDYHVLEENVSRTDENQQQLEIVIASASGGV